MTSLPERVVPLSDLDIDPEWNSRIPANVRAWQSSEADEESSGLEGLVRSLLQDGQRAAVDVRTTEPPYYRITEKKYGLLAGFRRVEALSRIYADPAMIEKAREIVDGDDGKCYNCHLPVDRRGPRDCSVCSHLPIGMMPRGIVPGLPWGCVLVRDHGQLSEKDALLVNAGENGNREGLTPPETLALIARLTKEHHASPAEVAIRMGKNPVAVGQYLKLLKLPEKVLHHWGAGGKFDGVQTYKRVAMLDLLDLAKKPVDKHIDGYKALLVQQAPKVDGGAFIERARERAVAVGGMLAKLDKAGFLTLLGRSDGDWMLHVPVLVRTGAKKLGYGELHDLSQRAKKAYEREMGRTAAAEADLGQQTVNGAAHEVGSDDA
jgi:hypothetical protein